MGLSVPLAQVKLPERIARLNDLAFNIWWTWHRSARALYRELDPVLWDVVEHNPVIFLHRLDPARLERAAVDEHFLLSYDEIVSEFDAMLNADPAETWIGKNRPELLGRTVAYFSAEFGLHRALPIYSGGLGVLAGDHTKEASDLGLPMVGVSLLYRQGYLRQRIDSGGWQHDVAANLDPLAEPTTQMFAEDGTPLLIDVELDGTGPLRLAVWRVQVGRVPIYLLDSDVEGNPEWTRTLSSRLYGGDLEHRLRQEIVLGIGGVRLIRALGIEPAYWHANEGHAALHLLERVREYVEVGSSFDEAVERVREATVFTTHTPVPAGHDIFPPEVMDRYFGEYCPRLGIDRERFLALGRHAASGDGFNFTALSLRLAGHVNAVSEKHGEVSRQMWYDIWPGATPETAPIRSITNGVHLPTWISSHLGRVYDRYLPLDWRERQEQPGVWDTILNIPDEEFWQAHLKAKHALIDEMDERARRRYVGGMFDAWQVLSSGAFQNAGVLTLGFARRFATYKRATLIFHDIDRLARIVNDPEHPVQIIFAGKAHPADEGGKRLIQEIYTRARDPRLGGRIAFAEDYEMGLASLLVAGVDVWLNNPRYPLEASGTSGMKASANGVPNCSILDGWWIEGYQANPRNGWGIEPSSLDGAAQDEEEADAIYSVLEQQVVPLYYQRAHDGLPHEWIKLAKQAIRSDAPRFSTRRMLIQYIDFLYLSAAGVTEPGAVEHALM